MTIAHIDGSPVIGVLFDEKGHESLIESVLVLDRVFSPNLLEAEVRAVTVRESIVADHFSKVLARIDWVLPDGPLSGEIDRALSAGYLRGADLWHLTCALYLKGEHAGARFLSLDRKQLEVARLLGFETN